MSKLSIIMPAYNAEKYISEAIDSILKQSYDNFELIIVDDGSTDNTLSILSSYEDKRIVLLENNHDFIGSLNAGLQKATGKYIVRMDADDMMHVDRLKIQHAIMEEEPEITICGTWAYTFGEKIKQGSIMKTIHGLIKNPFIQLISGNFISHPTVILRKDFLDIHHLQYENYPYAEDYKLWSEIAKRKGIFYIETQPLLYYRISEAQVTYTKTEEQMKTAEKVKKEIVEYLIEENRTVYPQLRVIYENFLALQESRAMNPDSVFSFFYYFFMENRKRINY